MEKITTQITGAQRARMERIKLLRTTRTGYVMNDEELVNAAIALYWSACEMKGKLSDLRQVHNR